MKKIVLLIMLLIIVGGGAIGYYMYNKPASKSVSGKADFTIDATTFFAEFEADEAKANEKYLNKIIAVKGKIADITQADSSSINIMLESGDPMAGIACQVTENYENLNLKLGDDVLIKGRCTGMLMDVVLVNCVVESSKP